MRKLRVLVLMHHYLVPPDKVSGHDVYTAQWRTEYDVVKALKTRLKHDTHVLGQG
jgi:D-alanine-D-alanine ligase